MKQRENYAVIFGPAHFRLQNFGWNNFRTHEMSENMNVRNFRLLKDKFGGSRIIVIKQLYLLPNTNREFFPSCDVSNNHKSVKQFSQVRPEVFAIFCLVRVRDKKASNVSSISTLDSLV